MKLFSNVIVFLLMFVVFAVPVMAVKQNNNSDEPIEITADSLEVFRTQNKAIFTGKVEAIQADMQLHSDVMTVFYKEDKAGDDGGNATGMNNSIERIKARGNVFLSTPEETAQGKFGDYDLNKKVVKLNDNVVLTKGKNVVKGDFFVYNLQTGHSKVWSKEVAAGVEASSKEQKKQRVRSVFVPKSDKENED